MHVFKTTARRPASRASTSPRVAATSVQSCANLDTHSPSPEVSEPSCGTTEVGSKSPRSRAHSVSGSHLTGARDTSSGHRRDDCGDIPRPGRHRSRRGSVAQRDCSTNELDKSWPTLPEGIDPSETRVADLGKLQRKVREMWGEARRSGRVVRDSRARLLEIQQKSTLTESDAVELCERAGMLLREMERFGRLADAVQRLPGVIPRIPKAESVIQNTNHEAEVFKQMAWNQASLPIVESRAGGTAQSLLCGHARSKSEVDLTRKLTESYDMQERLVADNADLEVKRYILYKELMTKDQNLEMCRAQVKRLQGELKLMSKENAALHDTLQCRGAQGDADRGQPGARTEGQSASQQKLDFISELEQHRGATRELEQQLRVLELELVQFRGQMDEVKTGSACGNPGTCSKQPGDGPPAPPLSRACGVCPPCPAPCNPNGPPTPAEKEVQKLTLQLRTTEENFKAKVTECAMLRTDLVKKKEELEKERCQHRETQNKLRELEMKFEGLATHTNMLLGSKEQAFEQEVNVRALKQCYREAREEIDELRTLMKEQNDQLQDYRVKYLQAQQAVEEQRRQMDIMDMDNTRISEQINLEIQRVKLKFQEKLQELAPLPDLLRATQARLQDAQQAQALAEHAAEQLARELNCAREKVHMLLHNSLKPPEKPPERTGEEKQMALLNQRVTQLAEANVALKSEIERLKSNVIRMEESVLANEKRLQEKMHECAQLGGELDRARDEASRALQRATERTDTIRKCMQTTIAEMERQLAASRAQVKTAEKEREELQNRMQCQIKRLNENFEQAQLRVLGLQTQVQALRRTASSTGEGDTDEQECACKSFFNET